MKFRLIRVVGRDPGHKGFDSLGHAGRDITRDRCACRRHTILVFPGWIVVHVSRCGDAGAHDHNAVCKFSKVEIIDPRGRCTIAFRKIVAAFFTDCPCAGAGECGRKRQKQRIADTRRRTPCDVSHFGFILCAAFRRGLLPRRARRRGCFRARPAAATKQRPRNRATNHTNKETAVNRCPPSPLSVSIRRGSPVTSLPATTGRRNLSVLSVSAFPKRIFL